MHKIRQHCTQFHMNPVMCRLPRVVNTNHRKMSEVVAYSEHSQRNGHWRRAVTNNVHSTRVRHSVKIRLRYDTKDEIYDPVADSL